MNDNKPGTAKVGAPLKFQKGKCFEYAKVQHSENFNRIYSFKKYPKGCPLLQELVKAPGKRSVYKRFFKPKIFMKLKGYHFIECIFSRKVSMPKYSKRNPLISQNAVHEPKTFEKVKGVPFDQMNFFFRKERTNSLRL